MNSYFKFVLSFIRFFWYFVRKDMPNTSTATHIDMSAALISYIVTNSTTSGKIS